MSIETTLLDLLLSYDEKGRNNECLESIRQAIEKSIVKKQPLQLLSFTCSTIQSEYMFSDTPWLYVDTNVERNNLTNDLEKLTEIVTELRDVYPTEITILIGNTDLYYIYLQQFKNYEDKDTLWKKFDERWDIYKQNLSTWLNENYPELKADVISWYEWEKKIEQKNGTSFETEYVNILEALDEYVEQKNLDWELTQLKTQFGPGKYFGNASAPNEDLLKDWTRRKFVEYAVQATWIYKYMSPSILIQNEKPSDLRSQMYQPLIQKKYNDNLPIVYFFGVDNQGYQ
jgi:hypothetical protein